MSARAEARAPNLHPKVSATARDQRAAARLRADLHRAAVLRVLADTQMRRATAQVAAFLEGRGEDGR
ncbi:MAG: hypothetical protein ABI725_04515 [Chloroflexota bacterium]